MADVGVEDRSVMAAFMQALGFTAGKWLGETVENRPQPIVLLVVSQELRVAGRRQVIKSPELT